jgi:two-component system, NarL family, sensor kinase
MWLLQIKNPNGAIPYILFLGTIGMLLLTLAIIFFIIFHQRSVNKFQEKMRRMETEQQRILLNASIQLQEEERQRLAADLHDDAGPLLATVRLYLNENLTTLDKTSQLESIYSAKQIVDDTIQLIRNISHNLMPPTLKNFGLASAVNDLFQKINGSGMVNATALFQHYNERMKLEDEQIVFRIIQELVNNILKHSKASFIHLTQDAINGKTLIHLHHDGQGLVQADYERLNKSAGGLGLKNIQSRLRLLEGTILFEKNNGQHNYKVSMELIEKQAFNL